MIQWEQPALLVDITETMELKLEAITCHDSQVGDFKAVEARLRQRFAALGTGKGYAYAEGFDHVVLPG
jgi:LmbE family N-acetylglucosaminyl deacetylase